MANTGFEGTVSGLGHVTPVVLAVDDLPDNLATVRTIVHDGLPGWTVVTALNGADALRLARSEDPDVILLDVVMAGMEGFDVCRRLKDDPLLSDIPVVFLTAPKADRENRVRALEVDAEAFLSRPLDEPEVVAQVRAMAKLKAASRRQRLEKDELAAMVAQRTAELELELAERLRVERKTIEQLEELRRWHDAMLGREERILELKREINELALRVGEPIRYHSATNAW